MRVMFPCGQASSASPLPPVRGSSALRVLSANPTSTAASAFLRSNPFRPAYSVRSAAHQDLSGSLRFLDTSFYERAVRSDPAAVSSHLALDGDLLVPSSHYNSVGLRMIYLTRLTRFTFVTARALLCLRLAHVVTSMSPRLDSQWGGSFPLPRREFHPLEASGLS